MRSSPKADLASRRAEAKARELAALVDAAHALAAAAGRGLEQHRKTDRLAAPPARHRPVRAVIAGHDGTPAFSMSALASLFEPMARMADGRRADEDEAGCRTSLGEIGILGEEAIAGMDRLGPGRQAAAMIFSPRR
jgi:hypothetical protein